MRSAKHSSVRWRIVLIYFTLVFIAMTIVSVFLQDQIKSYQLNSLKENIEKTVSGSNLISSLGLYDELTGHAEEIEQSFNASWSGGFSEEMSVVNSDMVIYASTNRSLVGRNAEELFDGSMIITALVNGTDGESETASGELAIKNYCYVIKNSAGVPTGVVYVRADLTSINSFLDQSRMLFIKGILIALVITAVLGFILAGSITRPVMDVTETVQKMSQGDFSTSVSVKSDDEIGQLAEMFNILRSKLDNTLTEISNEKNKLGTILEYMADGLIAIDLDGRILHANPAALQMLGTPSNADLAEMDYDMLIGHISRNVSLANILENCREEGAQDTFDYDGAIFAVRYDRFKNEDGTDAGIILIMQDITERQQLEDMQTDFVANVSHELKTPLTNIKSYTETLIDGAMEDPDTAKSFLGIIDNEADRMNRLVKDLLQLSRMDNGKDSLNLKETNILAILDVAVTKVELTAKQKNQQLNVLYDKSSDIRVNVDRDRFEQVVLNVLSNAIKYTDDGGRIDVDAVEHNGSARITVKDTGIGIPADALSRIFERFYRVDKARSRAMGGTGLGLAITKQIVEEHGGTIEAESREGDGTKFIINLPLANRRGVRNIE